ncbi:MAG: DUF1947 domain-containing protein [Acidilobus sp.]
MVGRFSTRFRLSKKALRELREEVLRSLGNPPMRWEQVEEARAEGVTVYIDDGLQCLARLKGAVIPTLQCLLRRGYSWLPSVTVDRGASQAVGRGADLMAPGVREVWGDFREGSIVVIVDEQAKVPVAVGRALVGSDRLREMIKGHERGKVVENLHHAGDRLWELIS